MTNTRAASATIRLRAKQELVNLLFSRSFNRRGPHAHRWLDHSVYSYEDLRLAYLKRIHELHPDKTRAQRATGDHELIRAQNSQDVAPGVVRKNDNTSRFVELQNAWKRYEEYARMIKKVGIRVDGGRHHIHVDENFTLFGVGCSFSDNEQEKELRSKIMDEASRGWFSAGQLSDKTESRRQAGDRETKLSNAISLASDDMFDQMEVDSGSDKESLTKEKPRSLISHLIPPHRR